MRTGFEGGARLREIPWSSKLGVARGADDPILQNQRMTKQISAATIEGTRKRGRPRKRWKDEVEEDLNIMGIKNGRAAARDRRKWRKTVLQAKDHKGL
jgi:hypothetical protein